MNVKELTHSQQQPQAPNAHKKKPTIRLTTRVTMLWAPPKVPSLQALGLGRSQVQDTHSATMSVDDNQLKGCCDQLVQLKQL